MARHTWLEMEETVSLSISILLLHTKSDALANLQHTLLAFLKQGACIKNASDPIFSDQHFCISLEFHKQIL